MPNPTVEQSKADELITTQQLAKRWGIAVGTLENWRVAGKGPAWLKLGGGSRGSVRYKLADVEAWEQAQRQGVAS